MQSQRYLGREVAEISRYFGIRHKPSLLVGFEEMEKKSSQTAGKSMGGLMLEQHDGLPLGVETEKTDRGESMDPQNNALADPASLRSEPER